MELCLGTVQFGMDYGVRAQKKPSLNQAMEMLSYAVEHGIDTIDTANAYGEAEDVVGAWLRNNPSARRKIKLISKLRPNLLDDVGPEQYYNVMKGNLEESLARLGTDHLEGYLLHNARYVYDDAIIATLLRLRTEGYVERVGVSVYEVEEAKKGIERGTLDFLQLPFNIFDQRMLQEGVFRMAEEVGFPLHSRSAFIQGLVLMSQDETPLYLEKAKPILKQIDVISAETGYSLVQLALSYVKLQKSVTHLVFGVDNMEQLKEDLELFARDIPQDVLNHAAKTFSNIDADIVMPNRWTK